MQITLYYSPIARSLVPYIALSEARTEFDSRVVHFFKGEPSIPMKVDFSPALYMTGHLKEFEDGLYFKVEGRTDL